MITIENIKDKNERVCYSCGNKVSADYNIKIGKDDTSMLNICLCKDCLISVDALIYHITK